MSYRYSTEVPSEALNMVWDCKGDLLLSLKLDNSVRDRAIVTDFDSFYKWFL